MLLDASDQVGKGEVAAKFEGIEDYIEVPHSNSLSWGKNDLSISVWVDTENELSDVVGDILSKYDPVTRRGFQFSILDVSGSLTSQSNR